MSLQIIIDNKLMDHKEIIEDISRRADKQWNIEKKINEIIEKIKE